MLIVAAAADSEDCLAWSPKCCSPLTLCRRCVAMLLGRQMADGSSRALLVFLTSSGCHDYD